MLQNHLRLLPLTIAVAAASSDCVRLAAQGVPDLAFIRNGNVHVCDLDGGNLMRLTRTGKDSRPALSPDGQWIAFQSKREVPDDDVLGFDHLYVMRSDGTELRRLTGDKITRGESPSFSPDGKQILFVALRFPKTDNDGMTTATMSIATIALDGSDFHTVVGKDRQGIDAGYLYDHPRFSPDGKLVVYSESGSDLSGGFTLLRAKTGRAVAASPRTGSDAQMQPLWRPWFTPAGKKIVAYRPRFGDDPLDNEIIEYDLASKSLSPVDWPVGAKAPICGFNPTFAGGFMVYEEPATAEAMPQLWKVAYPIKMGKGPKLLLDNAEQPAGRTGASGSSSRAAQVDAPVPPSTVATTQDPPTVVGPPAPAGKLDGITLQTLKLIFQAMNMGWRRLDEDNFAEKQAPFVAEEFTLYGPDMQPLKQCVSAKLPIPVALYHEVDDRAVVVESIEPLAGGMARANLRVATWQDPAETLHSVVLKPTDQGWRLAGLQLARTADLSAWQAFSRQFELALQGAGTLFAPSFRLHNGPRDTRDSRPTSQAHGEFQAALKAWREAGNPVGVWDAHALPDGRAIFLVPMFQRRDFGFMWMQAKREGGEYRVTEVSMVTLDGLW